MRAAGIVIALLAGCAPTSQPSVDPLAPHASAIVGTVLEGAPGATGDPGVDAATWAALIGRPDCPAAAWVDQVSGAALACNVVSGITAVSGGNGVASTGGLTPTVSLSGAYSGDLVLAKTSAALPDAALKLVEGTGGVTGDDTARLVFREAQTGNAWRISGRVNRYPSEAGPNQGFIEMHYRPAGGPTTAAARFEGNGNHTGSRLQSRHVDVPDGITIADPNVAYTGAVGLRITSDAANGVALQAKGPVDAMMRTAGSQALPTTYADPATHYANENTMRLPLYRVLAGPSADQTINAVCQPNDVVIGGSCTANGSYVTRQEPDTGVGAWKCTFQGGSGHSATAVCLKSY